MKKKIMVLVAGLLVFAGVGSAFAAAPSSSESQAATKSITSDVDKAAKQLEKLNAIKQFQDELHKLNALRTTRLSEKTQIIQKQDQILDLTIAARERKDKDALKAAADIHKGSLKAVDAEIKALRN